MIFEFFLGMAMFIIGLALVAIGVLVFLLSKLFGIALISIGITMGVIGRRNFQKTLDNQSELS